MLDQEVVAQNLIHSLNWLQNEVHGLAIRKGWYDRQRNPLELIALIMSELGEAVEACRHGHNTESEKMKGISELEEELADVVIRVFDMAGSMDLNLAEAIIAKHEYNKSRPERHGGKLY